MREKNAWVLLMLLLAGVVLGGFVGSLAEAAPMFSWLGLRRVLRAGLALSAEPRDP